MLSCNNYRARENYLSSLQAGRNKIDALGTKLTYKYNKMKLVKNVPFEAKDSFRH